MERVEIPAIWIVLIILAIINTIFLINNSKIESTVQIAEEIPAVSKLDKVGKIEDGIEEIIAVESPEPETEPEIVDIPATVDENVELQAEPIVTETLEESNIIIAQESTEEEFKQFVEIIDTGVIEVSSEPVEQSIPIEEVQISKDMDLTVLSGLSREDFIELLRNMRVDTSGFFEENAGLIYDVCQKYSINEIFFCGLIGEESGWNIAANHRRTHNYISLMSGGRLISYGSVEEGLEVAAQKLHDNYLSPSGKFYHGSTLSGVKVRFCPASDTWVDKTFGRMKQVLN